LAAHLDVVPVEPGTDARWTHPPFSGDIADGHVWGRGALDDKASLTAILQALEDLVAEGFRPARTIYLAFGHDEELGGTSGATAMASRLGRRGVRADFLVDEGMVITEGLMPGVSRPVALIGLAEKGFLSLELTTTVQGGHSSMPPGVTAVGLLARAIERLEANQMPARFSDPGRLTFEYVGPEMPFAARLVLANLWLFRPLLLAQLAGMPTTNASIRTTTAPTMFQAGVKDNVLPASGRAVVNFRILPGDSMAGVIDHVKRTIGDDRIDVHPLANVGSSEPSNVSPVDGRGFGILERTIRELFPETIVAPTLVLGGTDSRHYASITPNIYRFAPIKVKGEDLARAHGTNERISVANYADAVRFYRRLIRNCCRN
ncbi:MAG: M20/M25/M40 family metallo-hydrolase, partial [Acidobacteria bacterium]|nr:M20/M25/M40 family metallo-hydrolase [Acidobacteriota bacterium]